MRYIVIMEDGRPHQADTVSDDELSACDDGLLEVINCKNATTYYDGEWSPLPVWGEARPAKSSLGEQYPPPAG